MRDAERLEPILLLIDDIGRRLGGITLTAFLADRDERDLTACRLATIGEEAHRLSTELKQRHDLPWVKIYGLRNIVVHNYNGMNPSLLRRAAKDGLSELAIACKTELDDLSQ
jgi:uncharacterized protein with HEPN domain